MPTGVIPFAVSLDNVTHHGGTIRSKRPLTVESTRLQWDYAVSVPLALEPPFSRLPVQVTVRVTVDAGELGCLLVGEDWTTQLGRMSPNLGPGPHVVGLVWDRGSDSANLVFRNHGADQRPCVFTVEAVELAAVPPDPFGYLPHLQDVLEPGETRLDLARLKAALDHEGIFGVDDKAVFEHLRQKWKVVPAGLAGRRGTSDLKGLPADELRDLWTSIHRESTTGEGFAVRGWYQTLYRDVLRGKKVLDLGSGMGIDGVEFARHGARMTFVDIVEDNIAVMQRLCGIFGIDDARFLYLEGLDSLNTLDDDYDVVWCQGSLIHAPFRFTKRECAILVNHLRPGGRWIELAYPRERWIRDGQPSFRDWGALTDGPETPWVEWYDLARLLERLAPARFTPVLAMNFHNDDFNWFDLVYTGHAD